MVSTRNSTPNACTISTRKVGAVDCFTKDLPNHLWCSNCSKSSNRAPREKVKPCAQPWIYNDNSFLFQKKNYYLIQEYLTTELEPPVKKKKQSKPSSIRIDEDDENNDNYYDECDDDEDEEDVNEDEIDYEDLPDLTQGGYDSNNDDDSDDEEEELKKDADSSIPSLASDTQLEKQFVKNFIGFP